MQPFWILSDTNGEQIWNLMGGHSGLAHQVVEIDTGTFYSTSFYSDNGRPISPVLFKFNDDGSLLNKYYLTADTIGKGSCSGISQFNDTSLIIGFCWEELPVPNYGYCEIAMTDTTGVFIKRKILMNTYRSPKHILRTYDGKILVGEDFVTDNNRDIYMWKLNSDLEFDTLYSQPFNYDSLCPHPIVSDTIDYECDLFVNIEDLPTKEEYEQSLKVFPNPASEYVVFDLKEKETNRNCVIQIFNAIGTHLEKRKVTPGSLHVTINVQNYPPGPYIAVLRNDERIIAKGKFVVAKR
jgi:hypothetical protein